MPLLLFFFFISSLLQADVIEAPLIQVDFQQNPDSIKWKKIDTTNFEIIFSHEVEAKAQKVAHLLEAAYPLVSQGLEVSPKRISLILQNQSTVSNGFVTLAPRRSEWYMTPAVDPELTNTEWMKTLAVHEFRHVVQFQKSRQGVNRVFEVFLGEIGQALGIGLTMPPWFLEGDAVGIETALTKGGRGRLPLFERDLRTLLLSGKKYDYDKAHLGSYGDYLPNHYVYGYFLTSFLRNRHGPFFLSKLVDRAAHRSFNPLTFYNAYEHLTDVSFEAFYRETIKELILQWEAKQVGLIINPYEVKSVFQKNDWVNYLYPQAVGRGKYLALKKGLSYIPQFVLFDNKHEKTFLYPGPLQNEYPYKLRNGRFAFVEWEIDSRWGYRDFSRIKVFDLKRKKIVSDLRQTKGRLAVLDHSGEFILYVNWSSSQEQQVIVSNLSGKELFRYDFDPGRVITSLDWISLNEIVMVVKDQDDQKEIIKLSLLDQQQGTLLEKSTTNLGFITTHQGRILVESPTSGIDNIFEVSHGKLHQLTSSKYGSYAPTVSFDELIYNDYTATGMNVVSKKMPWDEEQSSSGSFVPFYEKYSQEESRDQLDKDFFNMEKYPVSDYSQIKNSLNLHSWLLLAPPLSSTITLMGMSRDVLNKFSLSVGANYDLNEKVSDAFVSAAWSHYYPVFDLRSAFGSRHQTYIGTASAELDDHWEEGTFETGLQVPWRYLSGRFTHSLSFRTFGKVIKVTGKQSGLTSEVTDGALFSPGLQVQYSLMSRMAQRDLNPNWGGYLLFHSEEGRDITGKDQRGAQTYADSRIYLPGLLKHHSFYHQFAYEKQRDSDYTFKSTILKPRGTRNAFFDEMKKYSGNYLFPLLYPDWHLSRYAYFKRISMNLFYDDLVGQYRNVHYMSASTGWELLFETNLLRIFIPITLGVRGSYVLNGESTNNYEFFINTIGGNF